MIDYSKVNLSTLNHHHAMFNIGKQYEDISTIQRISATEVKGDDELIISLIIKGMDKDSLSIDIQGRCLYINAIVPEGEKDLRIETTHNIYDFDLIDIDTFSYKYERNILEIKFKLKEQHCKKKLV